MQKQKCIPSNTMKNLKNTVPQVENYNSPAVKLKGIENYNLTYKEFKIAVT